MKELLAKAGAAIKAAFAKLNLRTLVLAGIKAQAILAVKEHGDELQEKVKKAVAEKGPDVIDGIFDEAQRKIEAKILAL